MMQCVQCQARQAEGKFCGKCGGELVEATEVESHEQDITPQTPQETEEEIAATTSNEVVEKAVGEAKEFGSYFQEYIKQPSLIFSKGESEFKNGLINLALAAILVALAGARLYKNVDYFGLYSAFSLFTNLLLFIVIIIIVTLAILFIINRFFGTASNYKEMTSIYGAHLLPVNILASLSLILVLVKSNTAGGILLLLVFGLIVTTVPIYLISSLLTKRSKAIDPLYGYLLYTVTVGVTFIILSIVFVDSTLGNLLESIPFL